VSLFVLNFSLQIKHGSLTLVLTSFHFPAGFLKNLQRVSEYFEEGLELVAAERTLLTESSGWTTLVMLGAQLPVIGGGGRSSSESLDINGCFPRAFLADALVGIVRFPPLILRQPTSFKESLSLSAP
jgi:hypothetical protein